MIARGSKRPRGCDTFLGPVKLSRRTFAACGLAAMAGSALHCKPRGASGKPLVAASIFPLFDLARRIAGDRLEVVLVLPAGRSEHSYDPSPREMARIARARLALSVGLGLDEWLARIVRNAGGDGVRVIEVGPGAQPRAMTHEEVGEEAADEARDAMGDGGEEEHHHGPTDPHVWLDPTRMIRVAAMIAVAFTQLDPQGAVGFEARRAQIERELTVLDAEIASRARAWTRKTIVTFHGSMGYFAARYGLTIAAVIEPFPGREPTARYLADVLAAVRTSRAAALFSEPQLDRHPAQVIADQSGVPLFEVDPVGGTPGRDTYERLMRANTDAFERALR
jgi:zinc transport system substrate-binding protein